MVGLGQQGGPLGKWGLRLNIWFTLRSRQNSYTRQASGNVGLNSVWMVLIEEEIGEEKPSKGAVKNS